MVFSLCAIVRIVHEEKALRIVVCMSSSVLWSNKENKYTFRAANSCWRFHDRLLTDCSGGLVEYEDFCVAKKGSCQAKELTLADASEKKAKHIGKMFW